MKRFSQMFFSWWYAATCPARTSMTTLTEREYERKRRLLSIMILFSLVLSLLSAMPTSFSVSGIQTFVSWIAFCIYLLALGLNRWGYLKLAALTHFSGICLSILLPAQLVSLSDPLVMLWLCFLMALLPAPAGLLLPTWTILLIALVENLILFWFLLAEQHNQVTHLLSVRELESYLVFLGLFLYSSAFTAIIYAITTKKAVVQADRAIELEQAHRALTEAYATIQSQALTDGLTGLPNHRAVMDQLTKELERARRYGRFLSLLFFDADRFKQVNDTHGHAAGDVVLCQIGQRVRGILRGGDTLGRFGGEEFVLLLPETDVDEARKIAERIRTAIAASPIAISEVTGGIAMTVSIGVSTYPVDGDSQQALLSQADAAMYIAKRLGRNQVRTALEAQQMSADLEVMVIMQQAGQHEMAEREGTTLDQIKETYTVKMIYSLLTLLERRDRNMGEHAYAVSNLATAIAQKLGLEQTQVSRIAMAALVHDIGKVAVPDALLQKANALSAHEQELLQEHAELGAQILEASPFLHDLRSAVRHHHEHWDGSGYPDQLAGAHIPLAARIISVCEAYDALLRVFPYQASRSVEEAMAELQHCAGTQFDPLVVQVLSLILASQQEPRPLQRAG